MKKALVVVALLGTVSGCRLSTHPKEAISDLGVPVSSSLFRSLIDAPGPLEVETVVSARWAVERSGLLNLDHEKARIAGLEDGDEPIEVYFHAIRHPEHGLFLVDTGVERAFRDDPDNAAVRGLVALFLNREKWVFETALGDWLAAQEDKLNGVFLTHLHLDHIMGLPDAPPGTPIYLGPGEAEARSAQNIFVQSVTNRALSGKGALREWPYQQKAANAEFDGIVDIFGDQSLFALHVPGHSPGSTAYLARTVHGPILFVGDASHTAWGWKNQVEPGAFSSDIEQSRRSLAKLRSLVAAHPTIDVRLGHQHLGPTDEREGSARADRRDVDSSPKEPGSSDEL
jgi:N-acyl homoserine lactone hydrolase